MYSNTRPGGRQDPEALTLPEGGLYLAGEGISPTYAGFMHGASTTGIDAAERIVERISSGYKSMSNVFLVFILIFCVWPHD